jgi:DNA helicase-2/ATP-dependent DNA helicase PcrA
MARMEFVGGSRMIDYDGLNPEQRKAVFGNHPNILCLAGAGTGKTQVLTHRIARLWEAGISPENMLALTFTRAAGAEMKERVIGLIGADGKKLFCNTFHAWAVEVIRENADWLGYEPNFSVYDRQQAEELIAEVLDDLQYKIPAKKVVEARAGKYDGMSPIGRKQAERAAKEYEFRLLRNNALDFDGLIGTLKRAILENSVVHENLRRRYSYVFVDEFQDTDPEQWAIVKSIGSAYLFLVGDDFQSIYQFRGSDIGIILGLAKDRNWETVKLERNYRSTLPIVDAANSLIRHNTQTEKKLTTDKPGPEVEYREPDDDAKEILDIIERLQRNQQIGSLKTTAILARTNKQIDRAKAILAAHGIPCETLTAANNPLSGEGAKELLAWIAAIENPQDDVALRKIAATKISKAVILAAEKAQYAGSGTFADALWSTDAGMKFRAIYDEMAEQFRGYDGVTCGANRLVIDLGIDDRGARYEISKWQQRQADLGEPATAADLLEYVRLSNVAEAPAKERNASKTCLMTVHGSKGLEFDEVFIIGAAQGTFPGRGDLQEERRLFYVAMTRARKYLNISCPRVLADWNGNPKATEQSQFIAEASVA